MTISNWREQTKEKLESLAAINYNLYFGSPAERADLPMEPYGRRQEWTYDEAVDEILAFIEKEIETATQEKRTELIKVVKMMKKPDLRCFCSGNDRCIACEVGIHNDALDDVLTHLQEDKETV